MYMQGTCAPPRLFSVAVAVATYFGAATAHAQVDASPIVQGVAEICSGGYTGSLYLAGSEWVAVASGDDDASFPSAAVAARAYGAGRVLALGHDGLFSQSAACADNPRFQTNAIHWLNGSGGKRVVLTTGHAEFVTALPTLAASLAPEGYVFATLAMPVTSSGLANADVLIVGNAWSAFTPAEVETVRAWVYSGGGLVLTGLGWSWIGYHPGQTAATYPMAVLGSPYGILWNSDVVDDPTNNVGGSAVFHVFYPNAELGNVASAESALNAAHAAHPNDLTSSLQSDAALRRGVEHAHAAMAWAATVLPLSHVDRQEIDTYLSTLVQAHAASYGRGGSIAQASYPAAVWIRERAQRTLADSLPLSTSRRVSVADALGMTGPRRDFVLSTGTVLADNNLADGPQIAALKGLLTSVPTALYDLRQISMVDFLGTPPEPISISGASNGVNVFSDRVGTVMENEFPSDAPPVPIDIFLVAAAHELNHVVDAYTVVPSSALSAQKSRLLSQAGTIDLEYLRSMVGGSYFQSNPQEFFASIANEWFSDSDAVFELALSRINQGRRGPLSQALFFAEVYSQGSGQTWFFRGSASGGLTTKRVQIRRDAQARIVWIVVRGHAYRVTLDASGLATGYALDCVADFNGVGGVTVQDIFDFLNAWFAVDPRADFNGTGGITAQDIFDYLNAWFAAC
jgi:hypothetical protein